MARIAGVDIPDNKKVEFSIRYIYGIGPTNALDILKKANIDLGIRVKDLTESQVSSLQKSIEELPVEGELRREVVQNIKRLEETGAYRGLRHRRSLPARGQRTRSNARTKRGRRLTVGTVRKDVVARTGGTPAPVKEVSK
jgi:small subunit ribosomal protein S13